MNSTFPDVVIFLPGIGGSTLLRNDKVLWDLSCSFLFRTARVHHIDDLTIASESEDIDLGDDVRAGEVIGGIHVIPGLIKGDMYGNFGQLLRQSVGVRLGENFFQFAYDWRRDNRVTARKLAHFVDEKLAHWREASGNTAAKVILIGHSMGGLVSRYYIECLGGWQSVRRLYTLGTPHRGSLNALGFLSNGMSKGIGPLHADVTRPLRSFASVHQLLPIYPCVMRDGKHHRVGDLDIPNLDQGTVSQAAAFHEEIQQAIRANGQEEGYVRDYLSPIIGVRQPTYQSATLTSKGVDLQRNMAGVDLRGIDGDGTVPAPSALPLDMDPGSATHVWGAHSSLCKEKAVREHMLAAVNSMGIDMDKFRSSPLRRGVSIWLEDAYEANTRFPLTAKVEGDVQEQSLEVATEAEDGSSGPSTVLHREGDDFIGGLTLPQGAWRLRISGKVALPIEDVVLAV